ncbi:MAG: YncE family protein [Myxococcota bacterium]
MKYPEKEPRKKKGPQEQVRVSDSKSNTKPTPKKQITPESSPPLPLKEKTKIRPGITRYKQVPKFWLSKYKPNATNYLLNPGAKFVALPLKAYDLKRKSMTNLPHLKRLTKKWHTARLVNYNPKKGVAGLLVSNRLNAKSKNPCSCVPSSVKSPRIRRLMCKKCSNSLSSHLKTLKNAKFTYYYIHLSIKDNKTLWRIKLNGKKISPLGVDLKGKNIMFMSRQPDNKGRKQNPQLQRLTLTSRKITWRYTLKMPIRKGSRSSSFPHAFTSPDLKKLLVVEYDERSKQKPHGYLSSPGAQGFIIDVDSSKQVKFNTPVTTYGAIFTKDGRWLYICSHQLGKIYKINTSTGKKVKSFYNGYGVYHLHFSKTEKLLYAFSLKGVKVYRPRDLKLVKAYPLSVLFAGTRQFMTTQRVISFPSGDFFMGIMRYDKRTKTSHSPSGSGFVHFHAAE